MQTYLDYAATTPVDPEVLEVFVRATTETWGNPSGLHQTSQKAKARLESARSQIASLLHIRPLEIYFTSTATEANNIAIQGIIGNNLGRDNKPHILISSLEHSSVADFIHFDVCDAEVYQVAQNGIVSVDQIIQKIRDNTVLICLMLVSNEIGTIQPVKELTEKIKIINLHRQTHNLPQIYIHCDCVQAPLYIDLDMSDLGVDLAVISGHKLYAPKGSALLYIRENTEIKKTVYGGGQEQDMRSGTQNIAAIMAFAKALEIATKNRQKDTEQVARLQKLLIKEVYDKIPSAIINGDIDSRIPNNIHFTVPKVEETDLLMKLDLAGFAVSAGSSCSSGAHSHSKISQLLHPEISGGDIRVTIGKWTTEDDIRSFVISLAGIVLELS